MKKRRMNLQLFEGGDGAGSGGQGGNAGDGGGDRGNAGYTYEQLDEVATARANKAERAAIANYLRGKGMSEEDITTAIEDFKEKKKANQPDVSKITQERDDALKRLADYENEKVLIGKGVRTEDIDYVSFKVSQLVTDKKDFKTAAEEYLKENPRYVGKTYQVATGVSSGNAGGTAENKNEHINNMIRNAFGR